LLARAIALFVVALAAIGCGSDAGSTPSTTASPVASASVTASASASATVPDDPRMGAWEGKFDAKRFKPSLDPGVSDPEWAADDGKSAIGAGTMTLAVDSEGHVSGTFDGALGEGTLSGATADRGVRVTLTPRDATAAGAMSGTLVADQEGDELVGEVRASSMDARTVRVASIRLAKK